MKCRRVLLLGLLVVLSGVCCAADAPRHPSLNVKTLDGGRFDLAAQRGKWVIVNFWATWCAPCIAEMPAISRFVAAHKDVAAIGLAYEDTDSKDVLAFVKKHPVVYPVAQVDVYNPPKDFATPRGLPTTYLIAPDGSVAKHFVGPIDGGQLSRAIAAANKPGVKSDGNGGG